MLGAVGETRVYGVETPVGLRISKVDSNILQPFHQLDICLPWSSQLYFSGECDQMTEARITDCYLFAIPAPLPPTGVVPFFGAK